LRAVTKKIAGLVFILLGFTPLLFVLFISLKKTEIRQRMKKELEIRELHTVVIPESEVIWMDKHEIWVNNSMFDIQTKKLENGLYTFTGLYDEEETLLVEKERKETGKAGEKNKLLTQLFKNLPVFCDQQVENINLLSKHNTYRSWLSSRALDPFREIVIPPPRS
jgi:hypothetical protein